MKNGRLIKATEAIGCQQQSFYCPHCQKAVVLRDGRYKQPYFSHQTKIKPATGPLESQTHQQGKVLLYQWGQAISEKVCLEPYLPKLQQQPDVLLINHGKKTALEYQCAPLNFATFKKRALTYRKFGYYDFWILGEHYQIKRQKKLSQQQAQFLKYHDHLGYYLVYLQPALQQLILCYSLQQADFLPLRYKVKNFSSLNTLANFMKQRQKWNYRQLSSSEQKLQHRAVQKLLLQPTLVNAELYHLRTIAYQQRVDLFTLLPQCLALHYGPPIMRLPRCYLKAYQRLEHDLMATQQKKYFFPILS